ncbi:gluconolactonase [Rivularia sp. PCC 7116]|uniref:L-dopachrome tautomerase-related protein n=1 Tax=Rivularia sp. PCC 7116 TaxID=373994 RepID=UPI00029EC6C3|nr:L-dopachrome tautomerase-related protein [Rivularia sp. PCC 7116]AFY56549.1 gluconolactonase [Rivularia sp. PCC 7116]
MRFSKLLLSSIAVCITVGLVLINNPVNAQRNLPQEKTVGNIETVATFNDAMPTGVTVSQTGRVFVNFPRWGDKVDFTVAEVKNNRSIPYPNAEINVANKDKPKDSLLSVQSVVIDALDRLWILDTGSIEFAPTINGGAKLVGVDLKTNKIFKKIVFPEDVALKTTYLNDVRFDLRRGKEGMAFITDSSLTGANAIIIVDLATGKSWRRLNNHPSTKAEDIDKFLPIVEGQPLMSRPPNAEPSPFKVGADGIAISSDGGRLYYCPLSGRTLYSVNVDALVQPASEEQVAKTVINHGDKGGASDGLESDAQNRIYVTNYEDNAILRRLPNGMYETVVHDSRLLWPDTLSLATNGYLYFTANQLHRQPNFHNGKDLRQKPYSIFRTKVDAKPVLLK